VDVDRDGLQELLAVNVGGQVMLWNLDGTDKGAGQDGAVAELPKGEWSSMPVVVNVREGARIVLGSTDGLLVCLDSTFKTQWSYQLPGTTQWSRAVPALLSSNEGPCLVIGDQSGTVTCLRADGRVLWTREFKDSLIRTYVSALCAAEKVRPVLVAAGEYLHCIDARGEIRWSCRIGGQMLAKPETIAVDSQQRIICANSLGQVVALTIEGNELWRVETGGEIDASITYWEDGAKPLIVCTGLWGDAIAFDVDGNRVWRHLFRSKNRARPLLADTGGDEKPELVVVAYNQHVYAFDLAGKCVDDIRVAGSVNASPIAVPNERGGHDIIVVSTTLQAHRFAPGKARAVYGESSARPGRVFIQYPRNLGEAFPDAVVLDNPTGRFVRVNVLTTTATHGPCIYSRLSSSDTIVVPAPGTLRSSGNDKPEVTVEVSDPDGSILLRKKIRGADKTETVKQDPSTRVWATPAYAPLDERAGQKGQSNRSVDIGPLYQGEIDQGAIVLHNGGDETLDARIELGPPSRSDGAPFSGAVSFSALVETPTLNGERVPDALVPLVNQGIAVAAHESKEIWVQVDSRGAMPGTYRGQLRVHGGAGEIPPGPIAVTIDVDTLRLPQQQLALCTWDYVPNKWFPENTATVLDDMQRHGVTVFPRTAVPKAAYDGQRLSFDWLALDEELARIQGRGTLLLQVAEPPIDFGAQSPGDPHGIRIAYLRALRDRLIEKGWGYDSWALYPVDEPGLDYGGNAQRLVEAGQLFREADPRMRIYTDPVPGLSQRDYERIAPYVDVWCPNMRLVSGLLVNDARMTAMRDSGKPVWSYECVSQVRSLSPLRYNRANAWRADYFKIDGIGFWTHSTTQVDPWIADTSKNDEYALVYPGAAPVSSVRWEAARDGIEDIGAIRVLEDALADARVKHPRAKAVTKAEEALRRARTGVMEMADEAYVESRDFLRQGDRQIQHTWWDAQAFVRYRRQIAAATHSLE
jgi:hypothetical protein